MLQVFFGAGSECFGYDDEISRDHDFEPGFCIFLPGEDVVDRRTAFLLERAYAKLPKEYEGFRKSLLQPVGGARHGVFRTDEFFREKIGSSDGLLSIGQWLQAPEQALAECTNGELYFDNYGEVSKIRQNLQYFSEDLRKKKLAGQLLLMAQSGQYNYERCLSHGEEAAAQLAVNEYVRSTLSVLFLLNRRYQPYYKWSFRAARDLPTLSLIPELLEFLLTTGNDSQIREEKLSVIENIAGDIIDELMNQALTKAICQDLEKHAYSVNDGIDDPDIRNLHIFASV